MMKKLGKLEISPEKIMKNEELINLQGGDGGYPSCSCFLWWNTGEVTETGGLCGTSANCTDCAVDVVNFYDEVVAAFCY
ncbi:MAG: hypothetical protein ACFCUM_14180 [Bacteroidales bacterium]